MSDYTQYVSDKTREAETNCF